MSYQNIGGGALYAVYGMLKHTLFSCVYAKDTFSIHKITSMQEAQAPKLDRFSNIAVALANLCISVHYGKLNLMLHSASKSQKITFILMKCTKTVATIAAPFGPDMHQIVCRLGLRPRPTGELIALPRSHS